MGKKNTFEDVFKFIQIGEPNECWLWQGSITGKGDPEFTVDGRKYAPYRIVRWLVDGNFNLLDLRIVIRHKCVGDDGRPIDNRLCCNPNHLEQGSQLDNINDMMVRGRHGLTKDAVYAIIKYHKEMPELTHEQIASRIRYKFQCECARQTVTDILKRRRRAVLRAELEKDDKGTNDNRS